MVVRRRRKPSTTHVFCTEVGISGASFGEHRKRERSKLRIVGTACVTTLCRLLCTGSRSFMVQSADEATTHTTTTRSNVAMEHLEHLQLLKQSTTYIKQIRATRIDVVPKASRSERAFLVCRFAQSCHSTRTCASCDCKEKSNSYARPQGHCRPLIRSFKSDDTVETSRHECSQLCLRAAQALWSSKVSDARTKSQGA